MSKLNNTANYLSVHYNITYFLRSKCKLQVTFHKNNNLSLSHIQSNTVGMAHCNLKPKKKKNLTDELMKTKITFQNILNV